MGICDCEVLCLVPWMFTFPHIFAKMMVNSEKVISKIVQDIDKNYIFYICVAFYAHRGNSNIKAIFQKEPSCNSTYSLPKTYSTD